MNWIGRPVCLSALDQAATSGMLSWLAPPWKEPGPTPSSLRKSTPQDGELVGDRVDVRLRAGARVVNLVGVVPAVGQSAGRDRRCRLVVQPGEP